jgi:hypothetical protein
MQAPGQADPPGWGEGERGRAVRGRHPSTILFVGTIDGIRILTPFLPPVSSAADAANAAAALLEAEPGHAYGGEAHD